MLLRRVWAGDNTTRKVFAVASAPELSGMAGSNWGRCGCTFTQSTHDLDLWADGRPHSHGRSRVAAPGCQYEIVTAIGPRSFSLCSFPLYRVGSLWGHASQEAGLLEQAGPPWHLVSHIHARIPHKFKFFVWGICLGRH